MKRNMRHALAFACRTAALPAALIVVWPGPAAAQEDEGPVSRKLSRQISVLEKVVNEVLVESPNIWVFSTDPAHGIYLEEFGVLITFDASLVEKNTNWDWDEMGKWWKDRVRVEREGNKITIYTDEDKDKDPDDEEAEEEEDPEHADEEDWEEYRTQREAAEAALYEKGKEELVNVLLDYGDTLSGLKDTQWVAIAAFLKNADYFSERKISHLVLKARVSDLRAYAKGDLKEDAMKKRLVEEEY